MGFPYKHCYFEPVCLLVKMASKTMIRPILRRNLKKLANFFNLQFIQAIYMFIFFCTLASGVIVNKAETLFERLPPYKYVF